MAISFLAEKIGPYVFGEVRRFLFPPPIPSLDRNPDSVYIYRW